MRSGTGPQSMVLSAVLVSALAGCTSGAATDTPSPPPSSITAAAGTTVPVAASVQEIPGQPPVVHYGTVDRPEVGVAYEYHLLVHCGIRGARFGDRWWRAVSPTDGPPTRGTEDGPITSSNDVNYVVGSMTLVATDLARLEWDGGSADFVPAAMGPQPCA